MRDDAASSFVLVEGIPTQFILPLGLLDDSQFISWSLLCGYAKSAETKLFKYNHGQLQSDPYEKNFAEQEVIEGVNSFVLQIISPQ